MRYDEPFRHLLLDQGLTVENFISYPHGDRQARAASQITYCDSLPTIAKEERPDVANESPHER